MALRLTLFAEFVWIAVVGMMFRGVLPYPDHRSSDIILILALFAFPAAVAYLAYRPGRDSRDRFGIALVQSGLTVAYLIALLPGAQ